MNCAVAWSRRTDLVSDGVDEVVDLDVGVDDERLDAAVLQQEVDLHHARWLTNALVRRRLQRLVGRHSPIFLRLTLRFVVVLHLRRQLAARFLRFTFVRLQCTRAFVSYPTVCVCVCVRVCVCVCVCVRWCVCGQREQRGTLEGLTAFWRGDEGVGDADGDGRPGPLRPSRSAESFRKSCTDERLSGPKNSFSSSHAISCSVLCASTTRTTRECWLVSGAECAMWPSKTEAGRGTHSACCCLFSAIRWCTSPVDVSIWAQR
jgi:hypothetical protein